MTDAIPSMPIRADAIIAKLPHFALSDAERLRRYLLDAERDAGDLVNAGHHGALSAQLGLGVDDCPFPGDTRPRQRARWVDLHRAALMEGQPRAPRGPARSWPIDPRDEVWS